MKRLCTHKDLERTNNNFTDLNKGNYFQNYTKATFDFRNIIKQNFNLGIKMSEGEELDNRMKAEDTEESGGTMVVWSYLYRLAGKSCEA